MRLTTRQRAQRRLEDEVARQRQQLATAEPCELHPAWRPSVADGRPAPPSSSCPYCLREALPEGTAREVRIVDAGEGRPLPMHQLDLVQLFYERHPEKAGLTPEEEEAALAQIDDARYEELEQLEPGKPFGPRSRFATGRIEDGCWIEFHDTDFGLVQVGPR